MAGYPFDTALVTGASSGIGEVMVGLLADGGVATVVVARRVDRLEQLAERHDGIEVLAADLTTRAGQAAVVDRLRDVGAPIDLVVNNAGFGTNGKFHDLDADRLADEIELNIAALTRISNAALSEMIARDRGWLLNVASFAAFQPAPELAVYAATKAYVANLTESLHEEVRGTNVNVTALCPGLTRTEFQSVSNTDSYVDKFPEFVWTSADEVAATGLADVVKARRCRCRARCTSRWWRPVA
jgi:short-subunit dehydrogenase